MPSRPSTDNFLVHRAGGAGVLQPVIYTPTEPLSENVEIAPARLHLAPQGDQPLNARASRKSSPKKRVALAAALITLGITVGLTSPSMHARPIGHVNVAEVAVVKRPVATVAQTAAITDWPVRIEIPKINVNAPLDYVGLTSQGALNTPKVPADAGWYDKGPRPGEAGTAVIDGHFGWKDNIPAAFDNLHLLQKGDTITVVDDEGVSTNFVVRNIETYAENQVDDTIFTTAGAGAHLNLITCEGTWSAAQESYSNRLVVFADKE